MKKNGHWPRVQNKLKQLIEMMDWRRIDWSTEIKITLGIFVRSENEREGWDEQEWAKEGTL